MIIQSTSPTNQAAEPGIRALGAAPAAKPVADIPAQDKPQKPSAEELKRAVAAINAAMQQANLNLEFSVDTDSDRMIVKMVDTSTGDLIRQYPTEETLEISRGIDRFQQGQLIKQQA